MVAKKHINLLLIFLVILPLCSFSQINETEIEQIYESSEDFEYSEEQIDYIEFRKIHKLNLLYASVDDLILFPFFDYQISSQILSFVQNNPNSTISQIAKKFNLRGEQIIILENCTTIQELPFIEKFIANFRSRFKHTDDPIYGFEKQKFLGNKLDLSSKVDIRLNNFGLNFVLDKDAGERNFDDYYSGSLWFNNKNINFIIGDFEYQLGMGNVLWKAFGDRKGINNISPVIRFKQIGKPYYSTLDYSRFRGFSLDYNFKISEIIIKLGGFYSKINKSATYDTLQGFVSSIYITGLYRTQTEINKIDKLKEFAYLGSLSLQIKNFILGGGIFKLDYDKSIQTTSSKYPNNQSNLYKTIFGFFNQDKFAISSEFSLDGANNHGFVLGGKYNLDKSQLAFQIRSYGEFYRSPYGTIFGEFSYPANEVGIYLGIYCPIFQSIKLTSFIDYFKSYGRTYSIEKPIYGFSFFGQADYTFMKKFNGSTRLQVENKTNSKKVEGENIIFQETDFLVRQEVIYSIKNNLRIRIRGEISYVDNSGIVENEWGFANFVEMIYELNFLKLGCRVSIFDTDSYNSAIWQYEYYLKGYMYSFPAYLKGSRYVLFAKLNLFDYFKIDLLYNYTQKNNTNSLGSGNDQIMRNYSNNLYLQLSINY